MKKRIRLLSIILSLSLGLSGCANTNAKKDIETNTIVAEVEVTNEPEIENVTTSDALRENKSVVNHDAVYTYLDYFNDITYTYNGEEFYLNNSEINEIIDMGNSIKNVDHSNISTDAYQIFSMIKSNSEKLASENDDYKSCFIDDTYDENTEFQLFFEGALYHILLGYSKNENNDIKEDFCKFQGLSICFGNLNKILDNEDEEVGLLGYYDEDNNAVVLDIDSIYILYESISEWYEYEGHAYANLYDVIMGTLIHEMNHVRQHACKCRIDAGQEYSTIGDYSEYVPTIVESSAESSIYNTQDYLSKYVESCESYDFTYTTERDFECFIMLLGLLSNDIDDYYNAIYDSDLNGLYEFTGCKDENDINRLYHILYNIDGLTLRNELAFNLGGDTIYSEDVEKLVGNEFSYEVLNIFTENLIEYVGNHDDMSDIDAVTLFIMAENLCLNHTTYIETEDGEFVSTEYDEDLVNNINNTRIQFEKFIMEYYGLTEDELYFTTIRAGLVLSSNEISLNESEDKEKYLNKLNSLMERFPLMSAIYDGRVNSPMTYQYIYSLNDIDYKLH